MIPNDFKGRARRIDDVDLPKWGATIGVGEDVVHAVLDVESRGSGFDGHGRPVMLFEPHVFWRELGPGPKRDAAVRAGLAYPKWKPNAYPSESYTRLVRAMEIDREAALCSASWGLGQIMGNNHGMAGWPSAGAMVAAFCDDEEQHLAGMFRFIRRAGLDDELRRLDWRGFARGYNGPGYAANDYHNRLARRYAHWRRFPDTPWKPEDAARETTLAAVMAVPAKTPQPRAQTAEAPPALSPAPNPSLPQPGEMAATAGAEKPAGLLSRFWAALARRAA